MSELSDRIKKYLADEYDIHSDEELIERAKAMKPLDIGIFTTPVYQEKEKAV